MVRTVSWIVAIGVLWFLSNAMILAHHFLAAHGY